MLQQVYRTISINYDIFKSNVNKNYELSTMTVLKTQLLNRFYLDYVNNIRNYSVLFTYSFAI